MKTNKNRQYFRTTVLGAKEPVELIDELNAYIEGMDEYEFNEELVEDYLAVLQDKAPVKELEDFDAKKSLMEFKEKYAQLYELAMTDPPRRISKKSIRIVSAIATAACLFFAILFLPTDAYGNSFMDRIVHWGAEVLSIRSLPPGGNMTLPADSDAEYRSIADALEKNGISSANCPTWIPAGFSLAEIATVENDIIMMFVATYQNGGTEIHLTIHYYVNPSIVVSVEKDPGGCVYTTNGREYYILENMETPKAVWADEHATYQILGDLPIDDLQIMLDSIQERR